MKPAIRTVGSLLCIMAFAAGVVGQSTPTAENRGERISRFEANQIVFRPGAGRVGLALTVSGPDGYEFHKGFEPGVHPTFSVRDLDDGLYSYELRIVPALDPDDSRSAGVVSPGTSQNERGLKEMTRRSQDAIVESGHFRVEAGKLVLRDVVERGAEEAPSDLELTGQTGLPEKDVCHNDDLIIDGSLCVGFDCVCNQAFGFDTIILKENNLRIYFDDTSTTASFPRNDWRIIANDSTNGGASYFGIQDATANRTVMSIEAGARSNALYVEDDGDIGVGTSTPAVDIHVVTGNTPTLRLAQDGSSGFSPQTWDVAGNETNFFIRDATFGSKLPFRIRPGAPTSAVDIASDGDVGVGEASPDGPLHVRRTTSGAKDMLILENNGPTRIALDNTASAGSVWRFNHADNGDFRFAADDGDVEFALGQDGTLTLDGGLITGTPAGTCNPGPCDGVFQPDYEVESIEDHAAFMWENSYLWGVGPTREGEPMNITKKTAGILHELEKAHIYIEQLHDQLREKDAELESVQERLDRIEALLVSLATTR